MKDASNLHLKVQNLCDCFATTDPLKEMSKITKDKDTDEAALRWIALAVLHGINNNAEEISLTTTGDGKVKVIAEYRNAELPSPGNPVGDKVIKNLRCITDMEDARDEATLAFGIRNISMDLKIKARREGKDERIVIVFPS
jgi:hypothetical protein